LIYRQAFFEIVNKLTQKKEEGNNLFKNGKLKEARRCYSDALIFSNDTNKKIIELNDLLTIKLKVSHLKIIAIIYSNMALVEYKLDNIARSLLCASTSKKKLNEIKDLMAN